MDFKYSGISLDSLSFRDCNLSGETLFGLVRCLKSLLSSTSMNPLNHNRKKAKARKQKSDEKMPTHRYRSFKRLNCVSSSSTALYQPTVWELHLDLACNKLTASDAKTLVHLLRHHLIVPFFPQSALAHPITASVFVESVTVSHNTGGTKTTMKDLLPSGGIGFLKELNLMNNNIGDDGLRTLSEILIDSYRTQLHHLKSSDNPNTLTEVNEDDAVSSPSSFPSICPISSLLVEPSDNRGTRVRCLERLSMVNNNLTAFSMQSMALVLMHSCCECGLVVLNLSYNVGIGNSGIEALSEGLIRNCSLKELYLRAVGMSFSGIFALSGVLGESKCLRILDIRDNTISLASLMALSKTLALNHTLISLLSDARGLVTSECQLIATERGLIRRLIDEIDSHLQRNRALSELSHTPVEEEYLYCDMLLPYSTLSATTTESTASECTQSTSLVSGTVEESGTEIVEEIEKVIVNEATPSTILDGPLSFLNEQDQCQQDLTNQLTASHLITIESPVVDVSSARNIDSSVEATDECITHLASLNPGSDDSSFKSVQAVCLSDYFPTEVDDTSIHLNPTNCISFDGDARRSPSPTSSTTRLSLYGDNIGAPYINHGNHTESYEPSSLSQCSLFNSSVHEYPANHRPHLLGDNALPDQTDLSHHNRIIKQIESIHSSPEIEGNTHKPKLSLVTE